MKNQQLYQNSCREPKNIEELYNNLAHAVSDIMFADGKITLCYGTDILTIEQIQYGYVTYLNGKRESEIWESQDIYFYALDFIHDLRTDIDEIQISDTQIVSADSTGLIYVDNLDRSHFIGYSDCARNYAKIHEQETTCIGVRDVTKMFFIFNTPNVSIKVLFRWPLVLTKKEHFLIGSRAKRFQMLQQEIINSGYSTYDLS